MKKLIFLLTIISFPFFFMSCEEESSTGPGNLVLSITDAPVDSSGVSGVYITINEIQVHTVDDDWVTMENFEGPEKFNLLDLTRGESSILGSISLEGGRYTQIRFILDAPERGGSRPSNPGCYIEFADGTIEPLFVPSGSQSGFKAVGAFTVPVNGTVNLTADFDVRKSVVKTGSRTPRYILKPVIRLVVEDQAGQIHGNVSNIPEDTDIVVYAYEDGDYTDSESATPAAEGTRFPNAVSSDLVDSLGVCHIAFLAEGTYDLIVTSLNNSEFGSVLGIIENVQVVSRRTTQQNIDISALD